MGMSDKSDVRWKDILPIRLMQHFNYSKNIMVKLIENGK